MSRCYRATAPLEWNRVSHRSWWWPKSDGMKIHAYIYIHIFVNMYVWGSTVGTSKQKKCSRQVVYSPASLSSPALRTMHWKLHCRRLASSIVYIHSEVLSVVPTTYLDRFNMIPNHQNVHPTSRGCRTMHIVWKLARNMLYIRCSVIKYLR